MSAPPTVTNSGEDIILSELSVESEFLPEGVTLEDAYEIEMTLEAIAQGGYERVRFLDHMLDLKN